MDKYLKMADVFEGRVAEGLTVNGPSIHGENHAFYANTKDSRIAVYAAHAINSHDDLVAEVERLREALQDLMDWTVKNSNAYDCPPYNAAHRLINK